jgi:hypothetical protein
MTPAGYSAAQDRNDCVVRALANASGMAYKDAFDICAAAGRKSGRGMKQKVWLPLFEQHVGVEKSGYLSGFGTIKSLSKKLTERGGTYVVLVKGHLAVFKDGQWIDWLDSNRMHRVKAVWKVA